MTRFQVVKDVIDILSPKLATIQYHASQPSSPLYNDMEIQTCAITFDTLVVDLREKVAPEACMFATFIINNILSALLNDDIGHDMKAVSIHRFLDSNSFQTGVSNVLSLWDQMHQLHECLNASSQILEQSGLNPTSMLNQIDTVLTGIAAMQNFYMQIRISLERFMEQLKKEEDELQDLEHEVRWLTAMSADLRAFSKTPSPVNEPYVET